MRCFAIALLALGCGGHAVTDDLAFTETRVHEAATPEVKDLSFSAAAGGWVAVGGIVTGPGLWVESAGSWDYRPNSWMPLLAVAANGQALVASHSVGGDGKLLVSSDSYEWRVADLDDDTAAQAHALHWSPDLGSFFVGVDGGRIDSSRDGATWTEIADLTDDAASWRRFASSADGIVGAFSGTGDSVAVSGDGLNWSLAELPAPLDVRGLAYVRGAFHLVAADGRAFVSGDRQEWHETVGCSCAALDLVAAGDSLFLLASSGASWAIYESANTGTWLERGVFPGATTDMRIAYSPERSELAVAGGGSVWFTRLRRR